MDGRVKSTRCFSKALLLAVTVASLLKVAIGKELELQVDITKAVHCAESRKAGQGDKVTVHYGGFLMDGTKFDSSFDRRLPFTFELGVGQVIPGWDQGLLGVCPGEERHLVVPANLAYGDRGAGDVIPPDSTLLFDVVVVDVEQVKTKEELEQEKLIEQEKLEKEKQQKVKKPETSADYQAYEYEYEESPEEEETDGCSGGKLKSEVLKGPPGGRCAKKAQKNDKLSMHYVGQLTTGRQFDSSRDRNKPFDFTLGVGQVIPGWDQGVLGMCVGEVRRLTVPPSMAYGEDGVGSVIPSCATLIFEVELVSIV